jgi:hypothetical protein
LVEGPKNILSPARGGIFIKLKTTRTILIRRFENEPGIVFHMESIQQFGVFIAKGFSGVVLLLIRYVTDAAPNGARKSFLIGFYKYAAPHGA